jgi:hypothetical protein
MEVPILGSTALRHRQRHKHSLVVPSALRPQHHSCKRAFPRRCTAQHVEPLSACNPLVRCRRVAQDRIRRKLVHDPSRMPPTQHLPHPCQHNNQHLPKPQHPHTEPNLPPCIHNTTRTTLTHTPPTHHTSHPLPAQCLRDVHHTSQGRLSS